MVVVPALKPVSMPLPDIVATAGRLLLQVQPLVAEYSGTEPPIHSAVVPLIAAGMAPTVTTTAAAHPVGKV